MEMRKKTEEDVIYILDCFSGADGGASFLAFRRLIEEMDKRAQKNDKAAQELLQLVARFRKLIRVAQMEFYGRESL